MRAHKQNWLDLFKGFRIALDVKKMLLGMFGVYVHLAVLIGLGKLTLRWWPEVFAGLERFSDSPGEALSQVASAASTRLFAAMAHPLAGPGAGGGYRELLFLAGGSILLLAVWSLFGGAIARIAAVDFARDERPSLGEALAFAAKKFGSFFWSPIVPLIFAFIFLCCNALLGLIGRIPGVGPIVLGILFFLTAFSSFIVLLLVIGAVFGAMFMWPTIAMEGTDAFDAISRGFNYLFARPWKTLWCWLVMSAYGTVSIAFVAGFAWLFLHKIALGSVAIGLGAESQDIVRSLWTWGIGAEVGVPSLIAVILIRVAVIMAWGLVLGFVASFKVTGMTIIYAVLRRDVDGTDMAEVYLPEPESDER